MIQTVAYYAITCDDLFCAARFPGPLSDVESYADQERAEWAAWRAGWRLTYRGDWCPAHRDQAKGAETPHSATEGAA